MKISWIYSNCYKYDFYNKEIKIFCATNGLKMNDWVEKELKKILKDYDSNGKASSKNK